MFFCLAYGAGYIAIEKRNANTDKRQAGQVLRLFFLLSAPPDCQRKASRARNCRLFLKNAARLISLSRKAEKAEKAAKYKAKRAKGKRQKPAPAPAPECLPAPRRFLTSGSSPAAPAPERAPARMRGNA